MRRPAVITDRPALLRIAKALSSRYPLKIDVAKVQALLTEAITKPHHFVQVLEVDGEIEGVLIALTSDSLWAERQNCNIVAWMSNVRGQGTWLLKDFIRWMEPRMGIKVAGIWPDLTIDPRALDTAEQLGFAKHGGAYLKYRKARK